MSRKFIIAALIALAVAVAVPIALIGGGSDEAPSTDIDGAFLSEMSPHHESAIEMAKIAEQRAQHPEIRRLAENIIATQSDELGQINDLSVELFGEPVADGEHGSLGLDDSAMGMSMDSTSLETAEPFDRAFIDMMIPHHQGAIRMAQVELGQGSSTAVKALATNITDAQSMEIEQMNRWRSKWYGAPSPAGGVPQGGAS